MDPVTIAGYLLAVIMGVTAWRLKSGNVWKGEAEAWEAKATRLETELGELRDKFNAYVKRTDSRMETLEAENTRLSELPSAQPAIDRLTDQVAALTGAVAKNHEQIMAVLNVAQAAIETPTMPTM